MKRLTLLLALLAVLLMAAVDAVADPVVTCHCFQDRSLDPQRPAAADPYLLATTQNTLLASAFGLAKKDVVRAKMAGASGDRLWVLYYLSAHAGIPPEAIAAARQQAGDWRSAALLLHLDPAAFSPSFVSALLRRAEEGVLAAAAADATLVDFCAVEPAAVAGLRAAGASNAETILAALLARKTGRSGVELLVRVRSGDTTWGLLIQEAAVDPAQIGILFSHPLP